MNPIDELFPASQRVIYDKAPLVQVVCQLRFPAILRIQSQPPADFQDAIRDRFPLLDRVNVLLPQGIELPQELIQVLEAQAPQNAYQFLTSDRKHSILLSQNSISLTSNAYNRWEEFGELLDAPLLALIKYYNPAFFSRVGLRYINAIERNALGLEAKWSELLNKVILGESALPQFETNLQAATSAVVVSLPDNSGSLALRHGLGQILGHQEIAYTIDFDFYCDKPTEVENAKSVIDHFNKHVGRAFRWCISDALHNALGPSAIE